MDFEMRIHGYTESETKELAFREAYKLGIYKRKLKKAMKRHKKLEIIIYEKLTDFFGRLAQVNLLRSELFDKKIDCKEVF